MTYATTKTFTPTAKPLTIECPDCGGRADYRVGAANKPYGPGYFVIDCPECGYYEFGCNAE